MEIQSIFAWKSLPDTGFGKKLLLMLIDVVVSSYISSDASAEQLVIQEPAHLARRIADSVSMHSGWAK
jgi:hypothetical protein